MLLLFILSKDCSSILLFFLFSFFLFFFFFFFFLLSFLFQLYHVPKVSSHIFYIKQGIQLKLLLGRARSDRPWSLHHASMPEHEALPSSYKMCVQIEAVIVICSGEDLTRSIISCPT